MKIRLLIPTLARPLVIAPRTAAPCALIVATLLTVPANSPAQASRASLSPGRQQLQGHVPAAVQGLGSTGQLPGSTRLNLAISLPLRNQEALAALIQQLYDPASLQYRHFLSLEQFAAGFGSAEEDYAQVTSFAKAHGLTVTKTYSSRMLVDVSGSAEDIQKAFHLNLNLYRHPTEDRDFYAPDREPSLDLSTAVLHVSGLNNYSLPRPASLHLKAATNGGPLRPTTGSGPSGNYMGSDFRKAYVPGVSLAGAGQVVGLLEFDGYFANDITLYEQQASLAPVQLDNTYVDGFDGTPGGNNTEVALDIEVAISMAPRLSKIIVYQAPNPSPWVDILTRMAQDTDVKQFSASWGGGESDPAAAQVFQQFAAQGQSYFNSSGDSDAYTGDIPFPSDNPYVTCVGGTTLTTLTGGRYSSEKVWNWGSGTGSSGGISTFYAIPSWQQGLSTSTNQASTIYRNIPDVALTADNIFVVADNGNYYTGVGGTSVASPLWAAFTSLVNEQATAGCGASVGFINPAIYGIGKGTNYTSLMNDIVKGNNYWDGSPTKFSATAGYDLCTGWGSPTPNLIGALAGPGSGVLNLVIDPLPGSSLLSTDTQPLSVSITGVTNAIVIASISGIGDLVLSNSGGFTYTNSLQVPPAPAGFAMTFAASAPNRVGVTNTGLYNVVPGPLNDSFVNATKIPAAGAVYQANNRYATIEPNEPTHNGDANAAASLWWSWTPTANTSVFVDTSGSRVDNVLAVYTGFSLTSLQPLASTSSDIAQIKPSQLTFNARAGQTYQIALASASTNSLGSLRLALVPNGQPDTLPPVIAVSGPQSGLSVSNGLVMVTGTAADAAPGDSGVNKVVLNVNGCANTTASGTTNWNAPAELSSGLNIIQATAYDENGNASAPITIDLVYFVVNPANDFFANAIPLTGASGTNTVDTSNATKEVGEPNHAGNAGGKSVWWTFTAPTDGVLTLSTEGSSFDTLLAMYTGQKVSQLTPVASNDDAFPGAPGGFSLLNQVVRSNVTYAIAVDGYGGASGTNILTYSFAPAKLVHLATSVVGSGSVQVATVNQLGGLSIQPASSVDVAINTTVELTPIPGTGSQFDIWSGAAVSVSSPLRLTVASNLSVTAHFLVVLVSDDFESGTLEHLGWTSGGAAPWFIESTNVSSGTYAARSGVIGNNQTTSLILVTNFFDGLGSFDYRVSSDLDFDFLQFLIDGTLIQHWSGEAGWATFTFPVSAGTHTLQWTYAKDPSGSGGFDAAFIDNVNLPISIPKNSTTPAHLEFVEGTDGAFFINLLGQTNQAYLVQTSSDLVNWQTIASGIAGYGFLRIDTGVVTNTAQFYRAVSP